MFAELKENRKKAWENFKKVRLYLRPLYYIQSSFPIGEASYKILNAVGQKALVLFNAIDLELKRKLWQRSNEEKNAQE